MKVVATIQLIVTLLTTATAHESARDDRQLHDMEETTTLNRIKLSPANELSPFIGVRSAAGIAQVTLDYNPTRTSSKWRVCIRATILGFFPGLLHIHKGVISENGGVVVDFSPMLKQDSVFDRCDSVIDPCIPISQATYDDIRLHPVRNSVSTIFSPNCLHNSDFS